MKIGHFAQFAIFRSDKSHYHMTHTALHAFNANYLQNPCMRAIRDSASRAGKSRTALLHVGSLAAPRDVIYDNFVAVKVLTVVI